MSESSLDLMSKMLKEAKIAQTKLDHANSQLKITQQKQLNLEAEIEKQTQKLLQKQREELGSELDGYIEDIAILKSTIRDLKVKVSELTTTHKVADEQYNELIDNSANATLELISINSKIDTRKRAFADLKAEIMTAKIDREALIQEIGGKEIDRDELNYKITNLKGIISDLEDDRTKLTSDYKADKANKESEIAKLSLKLDGMKHSAIEQIDTSEIQRKKLATWERSLEERDKNIRLRERKVEQGEESILRNSDYLNL